MFNTSNLVPRYSQRLCNGRRRSYGYSRSRRGSLSPEDCEFARTGTPAKGRDGKQVEWKAWSNAGEKTLILDTEAGDGIRMTDSIMTVESIKDRMFSDPLLADQEAYCEMYAQLFLLSYQVHDFWNAEEYASLGKEGCGKYSPHQFSSR